jgi:hypothetical protein
MSIHKLFRILRIEKKKGGPVLEEILLIGVAIFIFAIIFGLLLSLIGWAEGEFNNIFG